jgi:hypothetical protein
LWPHPAVLLLSPRRREDWFAEFDAHLIDSIGV